MAKIDAKILLVDDDEDVLLAAKMCLRPHVETIHIETNPKKIMPLVETENYDLIFLDMNFTLDATSGKEGFYWMNKILAHDPTAVIILMTAYGDIELAVQAIQEGASNFILKPWDNKKLIATLHASLQHKQTKNENASLKSKQKLLMQNADLNGEVLIGKSEVMQQVMKTISRVADTDANVLILGENGTGKKLIASAIHQASKRKEEMFVNVDLGAISETFFESELFGYVKGAFTDAREDRAGRFELANHGTLFLNEIGNLSIPLQSKLLAALQNRRVNRLGAVKGIPVDIRLLCATTMPLYEMVAQNKFRQDLLYCINTVEVHLPPLRERLEDLPLLVDHFLKKYCKKYGKPMKKVHASTLKRLGKHDWPGNIRELQHAIERAVVMSDSDMLHPMDFFFHQSEKTEKEASATISDVEMNLIKKVIDKNGGNITKAAKELGLSRAALYRRIEKYGL